MKKLLIISPYFPPINAADMQRVRMSLPYFEQFGWNPEVVLVDENFTDIAQDELLLQSVPKDVILHKVRALKKKWTSKLGVGSIALRSMIYYFLKVNHLLKKGNYDLIYFSTTQFPICILGAYWKWRFNIPYVIDFQDPWFSNYYQDKPKEQLPKKHWFSYNLNKYLEPIAMKKVDGIISVSESYIIDLKERYSWLKVIPAETITFGAFENDLEIARENKSKFLPILDKTLVSIAYVGRGGIDFHKAITPVFEALQIGIDTQPEVFEKFKLYFIGTSYASTGNGIETIMPLAKKFNVEKYVVEITDRISYYHTLNILQDADALFIPGSDDPQYTASKIYPYLLTQKPMLTIFNSKSSAIRILDEYGAQNNYSFDETENLVKKIYDFLVNLDITGISNIKYFEAAIHKYSAQTLTKRQCVFFENILNQPK